MVLARPLYHLCFRSILLSAEKTVDHFVGRIRSHAPFHICVKNPLGCRPVPCDIRQHCPRAACVIRRFQSQRIKAFTFRTVYSAGYSRLRIQHIPDPFASIHNPLLHQLRASTLSCVRVLIHLFFSPRSDDRGDRRTVNRRSNKLHARYTRSRQVAVPYAQAAVSFRAARTIFFHIFHLPKPVFSLNKPFFIVAHQAYSFLFTFPPAFLFPFHFMDIFYQFAAYSLLYSCLYLNICIYLFKKYINFSNIFCLYFPFSLIFTEYIFYFALNIFYMKYSNYIHFIKQRFRIIY